MYSKYRLSSDFFFGKNSPFQQLRQSTLSVLQKKCCTFRGEYFKFQSMDVALLVGSMPVLSKGYFSTRRSDRVLSEEQKAEFFRGLSCCTDKASLIKLSLQSPQSPQTLLLLLAGVWIRYSKKCSLCVSRFGLTKSPLLSARVRQCQSCLDHTVTELGSLGDNLNLYTPSCLISLGLLPPQSYRVELLLLKSSDILCLLPEAVH